MPRRVPTVIWAVAVATDEALGVRHGDFAVPAVAAIREQQERIDQVERVVAALLDNDEPPPDNAVR